MPTTLNSMLLGLGHKSLLNELTGYYIFLKLVNVDDPNSNM